MADQSGPGTLRQAIHNYGIPLLALAVGSVLSIAFFMFALGSATASLQREFESIARLRTSQIDGRIQLLQEKTLGALSFVRAAGDPDERQLCAFLTPMLERVGFELMGWLPSTGGSTVPLLVRADTSTLSETQVAAIATTPAVQGALSEALGSGGIVVSRPFVGSPQQRAPYVALLAPLSSGSTARGVVISVFDMSRVINDADPATTNAGTVLLFDARSPDAPAYVSGYVQPKLDISRQSLGEAANTAAFSYASPLPSTGGRWQVVFLPAPGYVLSAIGPWTWGALAAGLIITALVGFAMLQQAHQRIVVAARIEAGTRDVRLGANRLKAVFDTVVDGLITIDDHGKVKAFNTSAERIFGYRADEVIGRNVKMLMPEPFRAEHDSYLANYLNGGEAKVIGVGREVSARRKDGSVFPMELGVNMFEGESGRSFVGIIRDIRERKAAEEELRDSREHTRAIIDHALDAIISIDRDGVVTEWNAQAEAIFGWRPEDAIGKSLSDLIIPSEYRDPHRQGMERFLSKGIGPILNERLELPALTRLGKRITVELAVTAQKLHDSYSFTGFVRDISARKAAETEREALIHDLKRSNQELDDFAYIASHDLKEPLRGLFNNATFLHEDYADRLDAEGVRRLGRLGFLAQRMELLVNDLLYFSRLGRQELAVQYTDLNAVVAEIAALMETTLKEENAEIRIPIPLPGIVCDGPRITEVFRNLIVNAVKYNDSEHKTVEVGYLDAVRQGDGIITDAFYVRDNGIGIEKEFHEEIFRIFKRLNEESDGKKGTGAGLTFVKKIIERHGGRVWLDSTPGRGTTFYFTIKQGVANVQAA